jgi:hypothetical protein
MPDAIITSTASTFGTISGTFAADQSTITGTVTGIITGSLTGSVGVPGPAGPAGIGLPAGGASGQYLQKTSNADYATDWVTVNLSAYAVKANNLSDLGSISTARDNLGLGSLSTPTFAGVNVPGSGTSVANLGATSLTINQQGSGQFTIQPSQGIVFPNGTIQTTAFTGAASTSWGSITGTLSSQTDLQTALNGKYSTTNPAGYQTASDVSTALSPYLLSATASATYQTLSGMSDYLAKAGNLAGLASTSTARTNLGLGSLAVVNDAPSDGSQYARKNSAWEVFIAGDRYLTSSTTSNTVSNGTKSFTIGTGLSYTTTQNITISYDASNHMHGEVLTYNSGTGALSVDVNHHTGSGTYAAWVVNVGGVTPATSVAWGAITGTISAQTDLQGQLDLKLAVTTAASTYQTLSGMSSYLTTGTAASTYATKASPTFTGLSTFNNPGNYAITLDNSVGNYTSISSGVYSIYASTVEVIRLSAGGIKYPDGLTQSVAYPGSSGFLLKADNLSGLANTGTARTNLGLGTMAVETASNYLTTATAASTYQTLSGMSSYLTTASAASTYFTIASAANKADLASPTFSGTPSLPTGTTAVTQTTGNNTTAVATTAFVTAAVPGFATLAESIGGAVTNKTIAPNNAEFLVTNSDLLPVSRPYLTSVTSGAGASAFTTGFTSYVNAPNGAAGHAVLKTFGASQLDQLAAFWNSTGYNGINYSKRIHISGRCGIDPLTDANITAFVTFGKLNGDAPGDMVRKGIGWKYQLGGGSNYLNLIVHNGTSQTAIATTFQQSSAVPFSWDIVSDGSGGVKLYINGVERATTSAGPTGTMTSNTPCYTEEIVASAAAAVSYQRLTATRGFIYVQTK